MRATVILGWVGLVFAVGCGDSTAAPKRVVLTPEVGDYHDAVYSPDGTRLAYTADRWDGGRGLWLSAADGSGAKAASPLAGILEDPRWSPDGSQIVFDTYERQGLRGSSEIWVVSIGDGELTRLVSGSFHGGLAADPTWSPDGRSIAVTRLDSGTINNQIVSADLWVIRTDGTGAYPLHPLPVGQPSFGIIELDPSWSPDGSSIAFTDLSSKIEPRIGVVDVPTGAVAYLPTPRFLSDLSWSAEGIVASMGYPLPSPSIWTGRSDV